MTMTPDLPSTRQDLISRLEGDWLASAPFLEFSDFLKWLEWEQGQHIALIGPNGTGKTTFALNLLQQRKFVVATGTKPYDPTLDHFAKTHNFKRIEEWKELDPRVHPKRMLWPDATDLYSALKQRKEFQKAFAFIYRQGRWTLYIDELWFICKHLKLEFEVRTFLLQSRSNLISLVLSTQRPAWVPLEVYDMSKYLIFYRDNDEGNLKRIGGISYLSRNLVQSIVARLDREKYEVLAINVWTGEMVRTSSPPPGGKR